MTTLMDVDVDLARRFEARFVLALITEDDGSPIPVSLDAAVRYLQGIEDSMFLAAIGDWEAPAEDQGLGSPANFIHMTKVERISYASPLEVAVSFLVGIAGAGAVANRLISVWTNFQMARRQTATTNSGWRRPTSCKPPWMPPSPSPKGPSAMTASQRPRRCSLLTSVEVQEES